MNKGQQQVPDESVDSIPQPKTPSGKGKGQLQTAGRPKKIMPNLIHLGYIGYIDSRLYTG